MAKKGKKKSNKKRKISARIEDIDDDFVNDFEAFQPEEQYQIEEGPQNYVEEEAVEHNSEEIQNTAEDDDTPSGDANNNDYFNETEVNPENNNNEHRLVTTQNFVNSAAEINLNDADNNEEDMGFEASYQKGPEFMPKSMINRQRTKRLRREQNNFVKPKMTTISAFEDIFDEEAGAGRCRICYYALNGYLGETVDELRKMKEDPIYCQKKQMTNQNCEKADIFLGTFKMKYDELIGYSNKIETCAALARTWNNRINLQKFKYMETRKTHSDKRKVDDFFDILKADLDNFTKANFYDEYENESNNLSDDEGEASLVDWSFLPSYIDVDDVLYHFEKCVETQMSGVIRNQIYQVKSVASRIVKNNVFKQQTRRDIDGDEEIVKTEIIVDDKALFGYLTCVKVIKELCSEHRMTMKEEKQSLLYNNLALLKPIIPNIDEHKTVGLLKHSQLANKRAERSKTMKYQFKSGDTNGI